MVAYYGGMLFPDLLILVRGAGDLATGVIYRLHQAGFPVIATETAQPLVVRRTVAFAQAVFDGSHTVEGVTAHRVDDLMGALKLAHAGELPVLPDPRDEIIAEVLIAAGRASNGPAAQPVVLVDARLLKRDDATRLDQAPLVIGLGPGFAAGRNCHAAIETNRGHWLGRVLWEGETEANTGIPGAIAGYRQERLLRAPAAGVFQAHVSIGDRVEQGQVIGEMVADAGAVPLVAPLAGVVRGLLHSGLAVAANTKLGDIDPRANPAAIDTISDKSLAIGGAVLVAVLTWMNRRSFFEVEG